MPPRRAAGGLPPAAVSEDLRNKWDSQRTVTPSLSNSTRPDSPRMPAVSFRKASLDLFTNPTLLRRYLEEHSYLSRNPTAAELGTLDASAQEGGRLWRSGERAAAAWSQLDQRQALGRPARRRLLRVNTEWAMEQLRPFITSTVWSPSGGPFGRHAVSEDLIVAQAQVVEVIFEQVIPDWRDHVKDRARSPDRWRDHRQVAQRALAQLERGQEIRDNLGDAAPDLSAARMHPWAWDGARSLWASGHFREAVSAAAVKINAETQNKLGRRDLSEAKLFQEAFSLRPAEVGKPRLRLMPDDSSDTFRSLHEGASAFASGCYKAIRNP